MRIGLRNVHIFLLRFTDLPLPVLTQQYWERKIKCLYNNNKIKEGMGNGGEREGEKGERKERGGGIIGRNSR